MRVSIDDGSVGVNDRSALSTVGNIKPRSAALVYELDDSNRRAAVIYNSLSELVALNESGRVVSASGLADAAASASGGGTPDAPVYAVQQATSGTPTASSTFTFDFTPPQGAGTYVVSVWGEDANGNVVATGSVTINSSTGADTSAAVSLSPVVGASSSATVNTLNVATGNAAAGVGEDQSFDVYSSWSQIGPPTGPVGRPL